jgi:hypothetical protein
MDAFTEALAVVPLIHLPAAPGQHVLLIGQGAGATADVVLRYPTTTSVVVIGDSVSAAAQKDKRVQLAPALDQVPPAWQADLSLVVVPGLTDQLSSAIAARRVQGTGMAVIAVANPTQVNAMRTQALRSWPVVQPYREHIAAGPGGGGPAWFLLAGKYHFKRQRPMPGWTTRLSDRYLPALFTLAKDEYVQAFGGS